MLFKVVYIRYFQHLTFLGGQGIGMSVAQQGQLQPQMMGQAMGTMANTTMLQYPQTQIFQQTQLGVGQLQQVGLLLVWTVIIKITSLIGVCVCAHTHALTYLTYFIKKLNIIILKSTYSF